MHTTSGTGKDKKTSSEYLEEELEDAVLQAILKRAYATFKLFNGRLTDMAANVGLEVMRQKLSLFMHFFIPTIKFNQLPFYTDIHGNYTPLPVIAVHSCAFWL